MGHERPYTGDYWWTKDVGMYSCLTCTQKLFMSDHKYESKSGYPTFWNHIIDSVEFKRDVLTRPEYTNAHEDPTLKNKQPVQRCLCSNCEAHLGFIYDDGPGPFYKRFQINSAAIDFVEKPWAEPSTISRATKTKLKERRIQTENGKQAFMQLLDDEKRMGIMKFTNREKLEKSIATKAKNSKKAWLKKKDELKESQGESENKFNIKGEEVKESE